MVSATDVSSVAAANAQQHPNSPKLESGGPSTAEKSPENTEPDHVDCAPRKMKLMSQKTWTRSWNRKHSPWARICSLACFRGVDAFLVVGISQWYIAGISDFFLSGQPGDLKLGYGSSSVIVAVFFGGSSAIWTHYAITQPSSKTIYDHFPKGSQIWLDLAPITAAWAISEQITLSLPLALSRTLELRKYAFDPSYWGALDQHGQTMVIIKFCSVFALYLALVACFSIPANIVLRRIHASMLPRNDVAIVPFHRGEAHAQNKDDFVIRPGSGLSVSEAWSKISWAVYFRVLRTYVEYFFINQILQILYWGANWKLHEMFEAGKYISPNLPSSPSPMDLSMLFNTTALDLSIVQ